METQDALKVGPRSCPICGATYDVREWMVRERRGYTCSRDCSRVWKSEKAEKKPVGPCTGEGCDYHGPLLLKKWCPTHYQRHWRTGSAEHLYKHPPPLDLDARTKAWVAACLDCEGWIGLMRNTTQNKPAFWPTVAVGNTDRRLCDELLSRTGVGRIGFSARPRPAKDMFTWTAGKRVEVDALLLAVKDDLILKREQAEILLSLPPLNARDRKAREDAHRRLKALNRKGVH